MLPACWVRITRIRSRPVTRKPKRRAALTRMPAHKPDHLQQHLESATLQRSAEASQPSMVLQGRDYTTHSSVHGIHRRRRCMSLSLALAILDQREMAGGLLSVSVWQAARSLVLCDTARGMIHTVYGGILRKQTGGWEIEPVTLAARTALTPSESQSTSDRRHAPMWPYLRGHCRTSNAPPLRTFTA